MCLSGPQSLSRLLTAFEPLWYGGHSISDWLDFAIFLLVGAVSWPWRAYTLYRQNRFAVSAVLSAGMRRELKKGGLSGPVFSGGPTVGILSLNVSAVAVLVPD